MTADPWVRALCRDARDYQPGDGRADLAIFSPPYNCGVAYDGDPAGDALPHDEWCRLLAETCQVLADDWQVARIAINIPQGLDRRPYRYLAGDVIAAVGGSVQLEGVVVWDKGTTGNRTSWGSWRLPTAPALRDRTELIVVFVATNPPRLPDGIFVSEAGRRVSPWLDADTFTTLTQDLWQFPPETRSEHPAPFPVELPRRLIRLYGWPGCTVIDPYCGSGTTGVAAAELGAHAVLIDRSERYRQLARDRLAQGRLFTTGPRS